MQGLTSGFGSRFWRVGALALLVVAVWGTAASAQAHGALLAASPAALTTVDTAPSEVSVTYSADFTAAGSSLVVTGPDGQPIDRGDTRVNGDTLTVSLKPARPAGVYTVIWTVVATDGHQDSGGYEFSVARATGVGNSGSTRWIAPLTTIALAAALAGAVVFLWRSVNRSGRAERSPVRRRR